MSTHLTILLTIALVMLANAHPPTYDKQLSDEMALELQPEEDNYADSLADFEERSEKNGFYDGSNALDRINYERPIPISMIERLPTPAPQVMKAPSYKKSGTNYYMTLCHFKICNMGRKRDTRYLNTMSLLEKLRQKSISN